MGQRRLQQLDVVEVDAEVALELLDRLRLVGDPGAGSRRLGREQALEPAEETAAFAPGSRLGAARRAAGGRRTIAPGAAAIAASATVGTTAASAALTAVRALTAIRAFAACATIGTLAAPGALGPLAAGLPAVGAEFVAPLGAWFTAGSAIAPLGAITARRAVGPVAAIIATAAAGTFDVQTADFGIARNARLPLCPPNPIEFESAAVTGTVRA